MSLESNIKPYSKAIIKLLKSSPVEKDSPVWDAIKTYQGEIQDYLGQIGLELIVRKDEGFAYVTQFEDSEGNTQGLVQRRQIGFETSVVLVVLRQSLEEFDSSPTSYQAQEKFINDTEIREELELFLQEGYNKLKFRKELDKHIKNAVDLGYLKVVNVRDNETRYQIHRIIKEKITLDELQDFKTKLNEYAQSV
jgi:Domain of unknown function (DUF4194)